MLYTAMQGQTAVAAYLKSKQLLLFDFERQYFRVGLRGDPFFNIMHVTSDRMPDGIVITLIMYMTVTFNFISLYSLDYDTY